MHQHDQPRAEAMNASEARLQWSNVLDRVRRTKVRVVIEEGGVPVAAIISPDDLERLIRLEAEWDAPFKALDRTRAAFHDVPQAELDREVPKAVEEARAQLRAERARSARPA